MTPTAALRLEAKLSARIERVVSGAAVGAAELIDLIHAVNPTGLDLPPDERARRYGLKSRLQSRLVVDEGAEAIAVTPDGGEGFVLLTHRFLGRSACHARVDELEDEARALVRFLLDTGETAGVQAATPAPARGRRSGSPATWLAEAQAALEEWDYERARELLEEAVTLSGGALEPAQALLELLVDTLADDAAALEWETRLDRATQRDGRVVVLLAVADARSGDRERAMRRVEGRREGRVVEVLGECLEAGLREGRADLVARAAARLRERDPAHPALARAEEARREQRSARMAEREAALAGAEGPEEVALAREVLAEFPESAAARAVVQAHEAAERAAALEAALEGSRAALAGADFERARRRARRARDLGAEVVRLLEEIDAAELVARERRERLEGERVIALLTGGGEPLEARGAYVALEPGARAVVARGVEEPELARELTWLDALAEAGLADEAPAAVTALAAALAAMARGEAERALALVEGHLACLEALAAGRRLLTEARATLANQRRAREAERLDEVARLLEVDAWQEAREIMAGLDALGGGSGERERREVLSARVARRSEADRLGGICDLQLRTGALEAASHAKLLAERYMDAEDAGPRQEWERRRQEALRALDRGVSRVVVDRPAVPKPLWSQLESRDRAQLWPMPDRSGALATLRVADLVFAVALDDDELRPKTAMVARVLGDRGMMTVDEGLLWITSEDGLVLSFETGRWGVTEALRSTSAGETAPHFVMPIPGTAYLWEAYRDYTMEFLVRDRVSGKAAHRVLQADWADVVGRGAEATIVLRRGDRPLQLHRPDGALVRQMDMGAGMSVSRVLEVRTPGEEGERRLVVVSQRTSGHRSAGPVLLTMLTRARTPCVPLMIGGSLAGRVQEAQWDEATGLLFVRCSREGRECLLVAVRPTASRLEVAYEMPLPYHARLIGDGVACAALLVSTTEGPRLVSLGGEPVALPAPPDRALRDDSSENPTDWFTRRISEADAALDAGEPREVLEVIERSRLDTVRERQTFARLAAAVLALAPSPPDASHETCFRDAFLLATFVQIERDNDAFSTPIQLVDADHAWPDERLGELRARAEAWLEALVPTRAQSNTEGSGGEVAPD